MLDEAGDYKVKRIEVLPRKRLSYQRHSRRAEHGMVVQGTGKVTLDGREVIVRVGETVDVPIGTAPGATGGLSAGALSRLNPSTYQARHEPVHRL